MRSNGTTATPRPHVPTLALCLCFVLTALLGGVLLSACDSGSAAPTPTVEDSSQTSVLEASPGIPRGKAVFARYCNACHPGGLRGAGPSLIEEAPHLSDAQIKDSVRKGRNRMPAYDETLISNDALDDLVAYVRTLK
ncbi:MAG: c-type cytochrome [Chloroflexia bacterium]